MRKDREIRRSFCWVNQGGVSQQLVSASFVKYSGALAAPEWEDDDPGRVFSFPWHHVKSAKGLKGKFETLCYVEADISSAPYTTKVTETGKRGHKRNFDIILLVGLAELKAQVSWIDSTTVRAHTSFYAYPFASSDYRMRKSRGMREGL